VKERQKVVMSEYITGATETIFLNGHLISVHEFHTQLLAWDVEHRRIFPWRTTDNPFHILIAELMLRRTQAGQVIPVYLQFVTKYPDAERLSKAAPEEVARLLFPLGLTWRVPAFQQLAHVLVSEHHGQVPEDYDTLLTLPGVGDYVASAVCSFAFGQPVPIIDTNTVRVAGRLFGIATHAESRRRRPVRELLASLLDRNHPQAYNYSLLDLAALICTPARPQCSRCPLLHFCITGQTGFSVRGKKE
jgi:A/G-specific adenine glycosylase